jgi:hypothetical protein
MGTICYQDGVTSTITIVNEKVGLDRKVLYLGHSTKFGQEELIGKHGTPAPLNVANVDEGEGMKVGILALLRTGKKVIYETNGERWDWILWSWKEIADTKLLAIRISNSKRSLANKQTTVTVHRASWNDIRPDNYLFLSPPANGDELRSSYGSILLGSEYRHKIFLKGIYVETKLVGEQALFYGINFQSSNGIETGRDRSALVSNNAAAQAMYKMWSELITNHNKDATARYFQLLRDYEGSFDVLNARKLVQEPIAKKLLEKAKEDMGPTAFFYCPEKCDSEVHFPLSRFSDTGPPHYRKCSPTES